MTGNHLGRLCGGAALAAILGIGAAPARADLITNGFTFAVASASGSTATGTHFHSNTGGSFGNPAGKAEVGRFGSEEVRGLSEYSLAGLSSAASAFVSFNVFKAGGLFSGTNDTPFIGTIAIVAYQGNNAEDISDYQAASVGSVGSFGTTGLAVGNILSFDITSVFNQAITNGWTSLGIRLAASPLITASQAWTFEGFRLTSDSLCTVQGGCGVTQVPNAVPEPSTWALVLLGLGLFGAVARRRAMR